MQRIERRQRLQCLGKKRQRACIALAFTDGLPAAREPLLDLADLAFRGAHHPIDQCQALFLDDASACHRAPFNERVEQGFAIPFRSALDPVIQHPVTEPGRVDNVARGRAFAVHLPRPCGAFGNVGVVGHGV